MAEAIAALGTGVDLCYDTTGNPADPPLLLLMGLGGQLTWWDPRLCEAIAARGFFVVRFDNRDSGRSTHIDDAPVSRHSILRAAFGHHPGAPYTLRDMSDDAFGLLDHLGLEKSHVVGVSMGGMIAQTMSISRPHRVLSLVSIMSTTGRRTVGWQDPRLLPRLAAPRRRSREDYISAAERFWALIDSPAYRIDRELLRDRAGDTWDRGVSSEGVTRQLLAILTAPDRTAALAELDMPATVVHGSADRLVHVSGGRATAAAIPGAELVVIPGMGHDLPPQIWPELLDVIARTAARSKYRAQRSGIRAPV
jgi:pimeloyl-ACP methyl ester carboxylesterase